MSFLLLLSGSSREIEQEIVISSAVNLTFSRYVTNTMTVNATGTVAVIYGYAFSKTVEIAASASVLTSRVIGKVVQVSVSVAAAITTLGQRISSRMRLQEPVDCVVIGTKPLEVRGNDWELTAPNIRTRTRIAGTRVGRLED